jgi:hypothetical protein
VVLLMRAEANNGSSVRRILVPGLVVLICSCQFNSPTPQINDVSPVANVLPHSIIVASSESATSAQPPIELVKKTVAHELAAVNAEGHYRYHFQVRTSQGTEIRDVVETSGWLIDRVILRNGAPLSSADKKQEDERLRLLLTDRTCLQKLQKEQSYHEARIRRMMEAVTEAFVYEYADSEKDASGRDLVRLRFQPNPKFTTRSWELRTLEGITGTVLIDVEDARVVRIEARLFRDVDFGWGILGRVCQGGTFLLEQHGTGNNRWAITSLALHYTSKRLLLGSTRVDSVTQASEFHHLPEGLTLPMGIAKLVDPDQATVGPQEIDNERTMANKIVRAE